MPEPVYVNNRLVITKNSNGIVTSFPDICKTPTPNGPVPISYTNVARSDDLVNGSATVFINGAPVCLQGSNFFKSTGDEAGSLGGIKSGTICGKAEPTSYSQDVQIEGKNVVRHGDSFTSNNGNCDGKIIVLGCFLGGEEEKCEYCKKPKSKCNLQQSVQNGQIGNNKANNKQLVKNIIADKKNHPFYMGKKSIQGHHIICAEALNSEEWKEYCLRFGYDINRKENGVILPYLMDVACQMRVPVHRGCHKKGNSRDVHLPYPDAVKQKIEIIEKEIQSGKFCEKPEELIKYLDDISKDILKKIMDFTWTITSDGRDYKPGGPGCKGETSISNKANSTKDSCPCNRNHGHKMKKEV